MSLTSLDLGTTEESGGSGSGGSRSGGLGGITWCPLDGVIGCLALRKVRLSKIYELKINQLNQKNLQVQSAVAAVNGLKCSDRNDTLLNRVE